MRLKIITIIICSLALLLSAKSVSAATIQRAPNNLGLVGYWSFNDATSTKATDFSGNGNTGTLTGANGLPVWTGGKVGSALKFDGVDDYVQVNDAPELRWNHPETVSMWVKTNTPATTQPVFMKDNNDALNREFQLDIISNKFVTYINLDGTGANFDSVTANTFGNIAAGVWYHVVVVRTGSNLIIYVNGISDSVASTAAPNKAAPVILGAYFSASLYFNGLLDEVRIYNRALSADEIGKLYRATRHQ